MILQGCFLSIASSQIAHIVGQHNWHTHTHTLLHHIRVQPADVEESRSLTPFLALLTAKKNTNAHRFLHS